MNVPYPELRPIVEGWQPTAAAAITRTPGPVARPILPAQPGDPAYRDGTPLQASPGAGQPATGAAPRRVTSSWTRPTYKGTGDVRYSYGARRGAAADPAREWLANR